MLHNSRQGAYRFRTGLISDRASNSYMDLPYNTLSWTFSQPRSDALVARALTVGPSAGRRSFLAGPIGIPVLDSRRLRSLKLMALDLEFRVQYKVDAHWE